MVELASHYDTIIVGGGSAGCVLANRLSARPDHRVLLIEAGPDTPPDRVPAEIMDGFPMPLFYGPRYIWPQLMVSTTAFGHNAPGGPPLRLYEQGRVLGGGSSINVMAANRGLPRDYDEWASLGASGWGWNDVLPYFKKLERDQDFDGPLHGQDGPIPVQRIFQENWPKFGRQVAKAYEELGFKNIQDQNGVFDDGYFPTAASNLYDRRFSVAMTYLTGVVRRRPNLQILTGTPVQKITFEGRRATGVSIASAGGASITLQAGEVILSAGALHSPSFLLRAGIGPASELSAMGIPVLLDKPGVGRNLHEHPGLPFCAYVAPSARATSGWRRQTMLSLRYSSGVPDTPQGDMYIGTSIRAAWHGIGARLGLLFFWINKPYSAGQMRLASPDPAEHPKVEFNMLSDGRDFARMVHGIQFIHKVLQHPAVASVASDGFPAAYSPRVRTLSMVNAKNRLLTDAIGRLLDGPEKLRKMLLEKAIAAAGMLDAMVRDQSALEEHVRKNVVGLWHASGTCRIGREDDPESVVDTGGRVIGIGNLRVVDASLMPTLPTANTNIPTVMIAEKIADAIIAGR